MTPKYLIAEGHVPGRPSLLGKTIRVQGIEADGKVIHEDYSGVIVQWETHQGSMSFPFNYLVVKDE